MRFGSPFQGSALARHQISLGVAQGYVSAALRASNVQTSVTGWKPVPRGTAILAVMQMAKLQDPEPARGRSHPGARKHPASKLACGKAASKLALERSEGPPHSKAPTTQFFVDVTPAQAGVH